MALKHKKVSTIPDGADTEIVRPSDWNEDHKADFSGLVKSDADGAMVQAVPGTDYQAPVSATTHGALIHSAAAKTTPVDADMVGLMDSAGSNTLKKLSWSNIKATLKSYFDSLYALTGHTHNYEPANANIQTHVGSTGNPHGTTAAHLSVYTSAQVDSALSAKQNTLVSGTNIKTINGASLLGAGDVAISGGGDPAIGQAFIAENNSLKGWPGKNVLITSNQTWTVPDGVTRVRLYAFGAGGNGAAGVTNSRGGSAGGGGACAYGDLAVVAGDELVMLMGAGGSGTATTVVRNSITLLDANAGGNASGLTRGAASSGSSKHASITNGGVYEGGLGGSGQNGGTGTGGLGGGGSASGSPIGTGYGNGHTMQPGGAGWGGQGGFAAQATVGAHGAGVGGSAPYANSISSTTIITANVGAGSGSGGYSDTTTKVVGSGRTNNNAFSDILLSPLTGAGGFYFTQSSIIFGVSYPGLGAGGVSYGPFTSFPSPTLMRNGNIGSGGCSATTAHEAGTSFLGGGGGGGSSSTTNNNGAAGGYGGGGGGGGASGTTSGTGGNGGAGCVIIFW